MNITESALVFVLMSFFLGITAVVIIISTPLVLPVLLCKYIIDQLNGVK